MLKPLKIKYEYRDIIKTKPAPIIDFKNLSIPETLVKNLINAAEICNITQFELELNNWTPSTKNEKALLDLLAKKIHNYDVEEIMDVLEKIK